MANFSKVGDTIVIDGRSLQEINTILEEWKLKHPNVAVRRKDGRKAVIITSRGISCEYSIKNKPS